MREQFEIKKLKTAASSGPDRRFTPANLTLPLLVSKDYVESTAIPEAESGL